MPAAAHPPMQAVTDLRVNGPRLLARLEALAEIGSVNAPAGSGGRHRGSSRLALTDADRAGRDLVVSWMRDLGLDVRIDTIGNVVGQWDSGPGYSGAGSSHPGSTGPGSGGTGTAAGPPVMIGSHIDTVRSGGRFDGNLGVLAGLEVIESVIESGHQPRRPLAVAFFTNEEGARFSPDMLGSLTYVGGMAVEEALDITGIDGTTVGGELDRIGYIGAHPCPGPAPHAYVELHIEQGPVLEARGVDIGVVESVQGISWQELTIEGQANHAGTTPMSMRHDAGYAAAEVAVFVRRLALELGAPQVATVGSVHMHPDLVNVVSARATMTVDLRNTDERVLQSAEQRMATFSQSLSQNEGVKITTRSLARFEPVAFDPRVVDLVEAGAQRLGYSTMRLPSGAGHDAQMLARVCPSAMVFVPSVAGISHNPAEYTTDEDLVAGADVLLQVVLELAG